MMNSHITYNTQPAFPVFIIGAGGIVNAAHLPAYQLAGYQVQGICDLDVQKARSTAEKYGIEQVFASTEDMLLHLPPDAVVDIAVPASAYLPLLALLPHGTAVLLQKPMGENLTQAREILQLCQRRNLFAAVNFQLRYAPFILEAKQMLQQGLLGTLHDIEVNVNVYTPWHLWDFLAKTSRVEILYHSIHYLDLIRHLLGNPISIYAKTTGHTSMPQLASVRSTIIMDYGPAVRASILTNHCHNYGNTRQQSYIKLEGTKGAIIINFGALINYPAGEADRFEFVLLKASEPTQWQTKKIEGTWFPHAFIGSMKELMKVKAGITAQPDNSVNDCIQTMACVEAAYASSNAGGVKPDYY
ncbi:MAG TPA: Gfo/Idh/MocA family oxidoreductase [Phnomibacter sp.]|nr:Gfo/Idh/MocA family oxidoreductase [Phnomibacter sp.]